MKGMDEHQLTPHPVPRRSSRARIALIASIVVALAVTAYLLVVMQQPLPGSLGRAISALTLPAELRDARLVSSSPRGTDVYVHEGLSYAHAAHIAGAVRTLAPTERGGYAALARELDGTSQRLIVDGLLVATGASIRTVAVSTDGRRVAYVEAADGSDYAVDPAGWAVRVYYPDPQTVQEVGSGFAPFFIDDSTLGYFTAAGIFAVDLETGAARALLREPVTHPHDTTLVAPDRSHIAWEDAGGEVQVYALGLEGVMLVGSFSFAEVPGASSVALGTNAVYAIRPTNGGSEVWRQGFDGSLTRIAVLPPSLETTALAFIPH